ncbi:DUF6351 family protein [Marinobacterium jannaschii]|uniref:DUF6351 family protein n=1 Tax=Marinobacterium jannaschii TaxID=64970 RepID=UPI0012EBF4B3|nr:DUF6351 family protein [Marinobacterium jannaschii]
MGNLKVRWGNPGFCSWRMVLTVLLLLVVSGAGFLLFYPQSTDTKSVDNIVEALPADSVYPLNIPPYTGPHPGSVGRVADPFSYPIPVGETGPSEHLYAGPAQYPFYCRTEDSGLGQPLVDNQDGEGTAVYREIDGKKTDEVVGYSRDCLLKTRVAYYYNRIGTDLFFPLEDAADDIAVANVDGREVPYVVRVETGSINRFIYVIAALKGEGEAAPTADGSNWNQRLIYQFRGGVGIGKVQGRATPTDVLHRRHRELGRGFAVAYSSANQTSNHYNTWLAEETALRVKRQFNALYGEDLYTVGIGGSGGAIQQYLIGQNTPDLIDAAIPLYSYPDMITQTTYVFDCELLAYYFDVTAADNERWRSWEQRSLIEGMKASEGQRSPRFFLYDLALIFKGLRPNYFRGSSECTQSWRGLTQLVNNPRYHPHFYRYSPAVRHSTHWTYWDDLKYLFGTDAFGYANSTWDNVGVQYGLNGLRGGEISIDEFIHLNRNIGSWKPPQEMEGTRYWHLSSGPGTALYQFSPWSEHNMRLVPEGSAAAAPRQSGSLKAMQAAYRSGQVFIGKLDIPVIDIRHYLDDQLDMHHSFASFATRQRLIEFQGHADNQLIWVTRRPHSPITEALELLDRRLLGTDSQVAADWADACFDHQGKLIATGNTVWDGRWNNRPEGLCSSTYPIYEQSRQVAGDSIKGDVFKCHLQPIEQAIEGGVYGDQDLQPYLATLKTVFPQGVCDYSLGDMGRPDDLIPERRDISQVLELVLPEPEVGEVVESGIKAAEMPGADQPQG